MDPLNTQPDPAVTPPPSLPTPDQQPDATPPVEPAASPEAGASPAPPSLPSAPVEPEVETPVVVPSLPGQQTKEGEAEYLRQVTAQLAQELRQARERLGEYQVAGMSQEEIYAQQLQQQYAALQQQQEQLAADNARRVWHDYYSKWVPDNPTLITGDDPVQWQHNILTHLYTTNQKLVKQVEAMRKAATEAPKVPKVSSQQPGPAHRKPISQLNLQEIEAIRERARWGGLNPEDYPPIG